MKIQKSTTKKRINFISLLALLYREETLDSKRDYFMRPLRPFLKSIAVSVQVKLAIVIPVWIFLTFLMLVCRLYIFAWLLITNYNNYLLSWTFETYKKKEQTSLLVSLWAYATPKIGLLKLLINLFRKVGFSSFFGHSHYHNNSYTRILSLCRTNFTDHNKL